MKQLTLTIISVIFLCSSVFAADNISDNSSFHVFNPGETISSSKMNDNFEITKLSKLELINQINELRDNLTYVMSQMNSSPQGSLFYPDGFWGTPVLINSNEYTVPNGKTFYITAYNSSENYLYIDNDRCHGNRSGFGSSNLNQPLIVPEGKSIKYLISLNGFLVDKGVEAIKILLDDSNTSFNVPEGKYLVITLVYNQYSFQKLLVDDIEISDSRFQNESSQERMPYLIPSGKTIKRKEQYEVCITGYLKDN